MVKTTHEEKMRTAHFRPDEKPHIVVDGKSCGDCTLKSCVYVCPANLFVPLADGSILFNYEQCFECGACYVACNKEGAISWSYPQGGFGVTFRGVVMKVAVCVKWVADLDSVDVDPVTGVVDASRLLWVLDPGAETALALALTLGDVHAYAVGPVQVDDALRIALAAGAKSVQRLDAEPRPSLTASLLGRAIAADGPFDLVLAGTRSSDRGSGVVPALLAAQLELPILNEVRALERDGAGWQATRELERGVKEIVRVRGAAVVALVPGAARLPVASLPSYAEARRARIPVTHAAAPALSTDPRPVSRVVLPPRPRVLPVAAPEGTPAERLGQIMQGGSTRTRGRILEGAPAEMADAIMAFLRERGLLVRKS